MVEIKRIRNNLIWRKPNEVGVEDKNLRLKKIRIKLINSVNIG